MYAYMISLRTSNCQIETKRHQTRLRDLKHILKSKSHPETPILVTYRHSRVFAAPIKFVYSWCTDYSSEDSKITRSKFPRIILVKSKRRAVYASYKSGSDGKPKLAVRIVTLHPKTFSWHLDYFAEEDLEVGEYKLRRLSPNSTRLEMVLKNTWKEGTSPTKKEFEQSTKEVWDKYAPALEDDYRKSQR